MREDEPGFANAYEDPRRAAAYAAVAFPATYHLAYRDLPELLSRHVTGSRALDFGCGAGRSTRFLRGLGFDVVGVDISPEMLAQARRRDPDGRYVLLPGGRMAAAPSGPFDLVTAIYPFDNIAGVERRVGLLTELRKRLAPTGRFVLLGSAPELYWREWASFTTEAFPGNRRAGSGEPVRVVIRDSEDPRPIDDLLWFDEDYRSQLAAAGLRLLVTHRPLGRPDEPFEWVTETEVSPWVLYVGAPDGSARS